MDDARRDRAGGAADSRAGDPEGPGAQGGAVSAPVSAPAPRRPSRLGRPRGLSVWRALWRVLGVLAVLPAVFALIASLMLIGREVTAPSWIKQRLEARALEMLEGGRLRFGSISVTIGGDLHPRVRLTDAVLRDAAGTALARVPQVEALFSPRGLILERALLAQEVVLTGAQVALRRAADGSVAVSFVPSGDALGEAPSLAGLLAGFESVFERPALAALEQVTARGLIVNYEDAHAGRSWTVDGGQLALDLRGQGTALRADLALLSGRSYVTTIEMDYRGPRPGQDARFDISVSDAAAADIATQTPALSWLGVLDAPLSADLDLTVDAGGAVETLDAALRIGAGALRPDPRARPVGFEAAEVRLSYDPAAAALRFDEIGVQSDWGSLRGAGQAYLREVSGGWPAALEGQFALTDISVNPGGAYPAPVQFTRASADVRMRLDPFTMTFGALRLSDAGSRLALRGEAASTPEGWRVALDGRLDEIAHDRLLALWPEGFRPGTRGWFAGNVRGGTLSGLDAALRIAPGAAPVMGAEFEYRNATVQVLPTMPPVTDAAGTATLHRDGFALTLDAGRVLAPQGGAIDLAGSSFEIPDLARQPAEARIGLRGEGTITAALAMLDRPPFGFLGQAGLPVSLAEGRARFDGTVALPLRAGNTPADIGYGFAATLSDVRTETLVPGRALSAEALQVAVDPQGLRIEGPVRVGEVPATASFARDFGPEAGGASRVEAEIELSPRALEEFAIALPPGTVGGRGTGRLRIDLPAGAAPAYALSSDLAGLSLQLPALGWSKGPGTRGTLAVEGTLGEVPSVERIALEAAGLSASGSISLAPGGGLGRARFDRVRLGGWLDAPVDLVGRSGGRPPQVVLRGGAIDLLQAEFGEGPAASGPGVPIEVALDRLRISETLSLTDLRGEFDTTGGFSGQFAARVNGAAAVRGAVLPRGARTAVRMLSDDAGGVISAAGLVTSARGGTMDLSLSPASAEGSYDGTVRIADLQVHDAPTLASLLSAVSVVGLLQQMGGQGLAFTEVVADFRITPERITVTRSSAVGPALGISLDGIYTLANRMMDFQGVVSPIYFFNGIGSVLTRRGEGLIGFAFTLRGPSESAEVSVNPLSALAPGFLREMFRRPAPEVRP